MSAERARITEILRVLGEAAGSATATERFAFGDGRHTIRVANDQSSREQAYRLIYRLYLEKEYARPDARGMWLSPFDADPATTTLLVERGEEAVGAVTVVFDSAKGLPADGLYRPELDAMRQSGRRLAEIISLGVRDDLAGGPQVLVKLFNFAYFVARGLKGATDFVITVNPRHVRFYERLMLFAQAGPERSYEKVGGAPAVLLALDFAGCEEVRRQAAAGEEKAARSIYRMFRAAAEEPETVAALERQLKPMTDAERKYFFAEEAVGV